MGVQPPLGAGHQVEAQRVHQLIQEHGHTVIDLRLGGRWNRLVATFVLHRLMISSRFMAMSDREQRRDTRDSGVW